MGEQAPATWDEGAGHRLIGAAAALIGAKRPDVPPEFVVQLWRGGTAEDLAYLPRETLAQLAAETWDFLSERRPGAPKIRFDAPRDGRASADAPASATITLINDDMPFLFDSILAELAEQGIELQVAVHPVLTIHRDSAGRLLHFGAAASPRLALRESVIVIQVEPVDDAARRAAVVKALESMLADVRVAVQDWRPMLARIEAAADELAAHPSSLPRAETAEAVEFLHWLADNNFTFLGMRDR